MKFFALCLLLVAALSQTEAEKGLDEIAQGLADRLPLKELEDWVVNAFVFDEDFGKLVKYLSGPHYATIDAHIQKNQWQYDFLQYIEANNIPIINGLNKLRELLGLPDITPPTGRSLLMINNKANHNKDKPEVDWELLHLAEQIAAIIKPHQDELVEYLKSVADEPKVVEFVGKLKSNEAKTFAVEYVGGLQEFRELLEILKEGNLPMDEVVDFIKQLLWGSTN